MCILERGVGGSAKSWSDGTPYDSTGSTHGLKSWLNLAIVLLTLCSCAHLPENTLFLHSPTPDHLFNGVATLQPLSHRIKLNGHSLHEIKSQIATDDDAIQSLFLGAVSTILAHEMGHALHNGNGHVGFISQLTVGALLKVSPWSDSLFATGYHTATALEILTYYPTQRADIHLMDNPAMAMGAYSLIATIELFSW